MTRLLKRIGLPCWVTWQVFSFMPEAAYGRSTCRLTTLTVDPEKCGVSRDQIIDALEQENIEVRPIWKPMQMQPL